MKWQYFFLILCIGSSWSVKAQKSTGDVHLGTRNILNGIINTGNYNRITQINIKNPTPCQAKHILQYQSLDHRFTLLLEEYKRTKAKASYQKLEALLIQMDQELDAIPYCDAISKDKLESLYPELNCPFDFIEKGDKLYDNLDFINAHIWYSHALRCIRDPDLKARIQTKAAACKRKILLKENFLGKKEFSKIDLITFSQTVGWPLIQSVPLKGGKFLSIASGSTYAGYQLSYKLVIHDTSGNLIIESNLEEIDYTATTRVTICTDDSLNIYFLTNYKDSVSILYQFDHKGHLKRVKQFTKLHGSIYSNQSIHVMPRAGGYDVFDLNFNFLYSHNTDNGYSACYLARDLDMICLQRFSNQETDSFLCFTYTGAEINRIKPNALKKHIGFQEAARNYENNLYPIRAGKLITPKFAFPNVELTKYYQRLNLQNPEQSQNFKGKKCTLTTDSLTNYYYVGQWHCWIKLTYKYRFQKHLTSMELVDIYSGKSIKQRTFPEAYDVQIGGLQNKRTELFIYFKYPTTEGYVYQLQVIDSSLNNSNDKVLLKSFQDDEFILWHISLKDRVFIFTLHERLVFGSDRKSWNYRIHEYQKDGEPKGYFDVYDSTSLFNEKRINNLVLLVDSKFDPIKEVNHFRTCICSFKGESFADSSEVKNSDIFACEPIIQSFSNLDYFIGKSTIILTGIESIPDGQSTRGVGAVVICDSSFKILKKITCLTSTISQVYNPTPINDSIIAVTQAIYERVREGISHRDAQSAILLININTGTIIKQFPITTLGFNALYSLHYDPSGQLLRIVGSTNHFRILEGQTTYKTLEDEDFFFQDILISDYVKK